MLLCETEKTPYCGKVVGVLPYFLVEDAFFINKNIKSHADCPQKEKIHKTLDRQRAFDLLIIQFLLTVQSGT